MDGGEGNCLRPPGRVGAVGKERVDRRFLKLARAHQSVAKLDFRLGPILSPVRSTVVNRRFGRADDLLEAQNSEPRRQRTTEVVVDPALARPREPPLPERPDLSRLGDADGQEVGLDQQDRAAYRRLAARFAIAVSASVTYRAGGHEVKPPGSTGPAMMALSQPKRRCARLDQRQIEVERDSKAIGSDALAKPHRDRAIAAADLQRQRTGADAERLDLPAM